jgi:protein NRD1
MPREHIKVLSRTLFVGGAGGTEGEIRGIFSRFGKVQTCIVNQEKRHAFVKMVNRRDAVSAKEGMDNIQDPDALSKARQVRFPLVQNFDRH